MPDRGVCPCCGRRRYLAGGLLGLHQNLGGTICAGSGGPPWTAPDQRDGREEASDA